MSTNRVHTVHRAGAAGLGGFLVAFGLAGLTLGAGFLATSGPIVMGLSTNGLLSTLSLVVGVVGVVLVGAAVRGGQVASTVSVAVGTLFLASGIVNALVLDTSLNMLAFRMANVVFSLLVGAALLYVGAYGRFTVDLPASSPYARERTRVELPVHRTDGALERAMAAAERAVALHVATVDQARRVAAASAFRTAEARRAAFSNVN